LLRGLDSRLQGVVAGCMCPSSSPLFGNVGAFPFPSWLSRARMPRIAMVIIMPDTETV
jgi:hypothetical protein